MAGYPTDKDTMREFYPGSGVWKQEMFVYFDEDMLGPNSGDGRRYGTVQYLARARECKDGLLIFVPGVTLEDIKK